MKTKEELNALKEELAQICGGNSSNIPHGPDIKLNLINPSDGGDPTVKATLITFDPPIAQ